MFEFIKTLNNFGLPRVITDLFSLAEHCKNSSREACPRPNCCGDTGQKFAKEATIGSRFDPMNLVRQRETARKQQEFLKTEGKSVDRIKARIKRNATYNVKTRIDNESKGNSNKDKCPKCFRPKHLPKNCPAKELIGRKGGEQGHWQRACRSKIEKPVDEIGPGAIVSNNWFLGEIVIHNAESRPWEAILTLNSRNFLFKLVSAANVTVLPPQVYRQIEKKTNVTNKFKSAFNCGRCLKELIHKRTNQTS